jgi:hypothetical protein
LAASEATAIEWGASLSTIQWHNLRATYPPIKQVQFASLFEILISKSDVKKKY